MCQAKIIVSKEAASCWLHEYHVSEQHNRHRSPICPAFPLVSLLFPLPFFDVSAHSPRFVAPLRYVAVGGREVFVVPVHAAPVPYRWLPFYFRNPWLPPRLP